MTGNADHQGIAALFTTRFVKPYFLILDDVKTLLKHVTFLHSVLKQCFRKPNLFWMNGGGIL
jgi:hypothetical protein